MIGVVLPDRALSPDEARGFRMACACFSTWGYQLAASPRLAGPKAPEAMRQTFAGHGRFLMAAASAMDRQITKAVPPEALAEISVSACAPRAG
jgi:hypothetical protein